MSCKRKWHCLLLWIWRGGVGVKQISNSLLSFPIILLLPIYLFISTVFLFFLFSTFNCSLTFSSEFKQKRLLCLLILLLSVSKFHIIYTYKPLLSTSFIEIYQRQGEGKLAWGQIWQKKKIPLLFPKPRLPTEGKGKPSWGKTAWVSQKMPGGERHEGSCSPRARAFFTRQAEPSAETWEHLPCASRATGKRACCSLYWAQFSPLSFPNRPIFLQILHSFLLLLSTKLLATFLTQLSPQLKI